MKNKQKFFSLSLYVDALKQLRVIGIIMLIFVGFVSSSIALLDGGSYSVYFLSLFSFMIFSPIMTIYIFRFLTSRKASDVFHSMPYKRVCLYFSYVFAVLTYVVAILIVNFLGFSIFSGEFGGITPSLIISLIVCNLLVISAITLAQGMTGTIFTNISVTGIILFFPRLLIYFIASFVCEFCPYINMDCIKFPFGTTSNILTGMFIDAYSIRIDADVKGTIYSFVLSLIYFAIAAILFSRRKSEIAEAPAASRLVQHIIRSIITLVICLLPLSEILYRFADNDDYYYGDFDSEVIIYLFAIFIYFLYELLSTKKVKNLVKIIPGIIVIAILNVAIVLSVFGISEHVKKFQPKAEDVEYVIIKQNEDMTSSNIFDMRYVMEVVKEHKVQDKQIIEMLCQRLEYMVNNEDGNRYGDYIVGFCVDGKVHYRYINFNAEQNTLLMKEICANVFKEYKTLPVCNEIECVELHQMYVGGSYGGISEGMLKEMYELYVKDLSQLSGKKIAELTTRNYDKCDVLEIKYRVKDYTHWLTLPIVPELKKSYNKYLEILYNGLELYNGDLNEIVYEAVRKRDALVFKLSVMESGRIIETIWFDIAFLETVDYSAVALKEKWLAFCEEANTSKVKPNSDGVIYIIEASTEKFIFSANDKCYEIFKEMK